MDWDSTQRLINQTQDTDSVRINETIVNEFIKKSFEEISIPEARELLKTTGSFFGGLTGSGKSFLNNGAFGLEPYFTHGEELTWEGKKWWGSFQHFLTFDNIGFYNVWEYIFNWSKALKAQPGDQSPFLECTRHPITGQFLVPYERSTVSTLPEIIVGETFHPYHFLLMYLHNLIPGNAAWISVGGDGYGIEGRMIRRIMRQGNGNMNLTLKSIGTSQINAVHAMEQFITKLMESTTSQKIYSIQNNYSPEELKGYLDPDFIEEFTIRGGRVFNKKSLSSPITKREYWGIHPWYPCNYLVIYYCADINFAFPLQNNDVPLAEADIALLIDPILYAEKYKPHHLFPKVTEEELQRHKIIYD